MRNTVELKLKVAELKATKPVNFELECKKRAVIATIQTLAVWNNVKIDSEYLKTRTLKDLNTSLENIMIKEVIRRKALSASSYRGRSSKFETGMENHEDSNYHSDRNWWMESFGKVER